MEEEQYKAILNYVAKKEYPQGYNKNQKYVLRRACKSYVVEGGQLFYVDQREDGSTFNRLVIRGREEVERVFMECHLTAGGHRGRDATVGKIKERYYWPYYYKEVEQKVSSFISRQANNYQELQPTANSGNPFPPTPTDQDV